MDRRLGLEKEAGIGGGTVSEESRAACVLIVSHLCERLPNHTGGPLSLEKAESYAGSKKRKPAKVKKAIPHLVKALKDPNNLDALIQAAFFGTASDAAEVLEYAESVGAFSINFILTSASKYTMVQGVLN
jgi:hypothetical protein